MLRRGPQSCCCTGEGNMSVEIAAFARLSGTPLDGATSLQVLQIFESEGAREPDSNKTNQNCRGFLPPQEESRSRSYAVVVRHKASPSEECVMAKCLCFYPGWSVQRSKVSYIQLYPFT